eukprot:TRINITY_DN2337_c1_g1_i1.p1 TRINITY_DN2337_c1_g1~~TRINITY_DN2337_c1_g1_i1.p1  ORF type:complete len:1059 (-),score=167.30 TRINITY_DN2337_c1_g1_i1:1624-4800(-)
MGANGSTLSPKKRAPPQTTVTFQALQSMYDSGKRRLDLRNKYLKEVPAGVLDIADLLWLSVNQNSIEVIPTALCDMKDLAVLRCFSNEILVVPSEIGRLVQLNTLDVGKNKLSEVTPEICTLTSLKELHLHWNSISVVPEEIGKLVELKSLSLYINKISTLPASLGNLTNLVQLDLAHNHITSLPDVLFECRALTTLSLVGNQFEEMPDRIDQLTNLTRLDLRCNRLKSLPESIGALTSCRSLFLQINRLDSLPSSIGHLTCMTDLRISENNISRLEDSIAQLPNLRSIQADRNNLIYMAPEIGALAMIRELDLQFNGLESLPDALGGLVTLERLYLGNNKLRTVPDCVGKMTRLHNLSLIRNRLECLPAWLGELVGLSKLNASANRIRTLPVAALAKLGKLQVLELADNCISELPLSLKGLEALRTLNVSHNDLEVLADCFADVAKTLRCLSVSYNNFGPAVVWPESMRSLTCLVEFVCSGCGLTTVPRFLSKCSSIESIFLSNNMIECFPPDTLLNKVSLRSLACANNRLTLFPESIFTCQSLSELDLAHNFIPSIPDALSTLPQLAELNLTNNCLEKLPKTSLKSASALRSLILSHNRIQTLTRYVPNDAVNAWIACDGLELAQVDRWLDATKTMRLFLEKTLKWQRKQVAKQGEVALNRAKFNFRLGWSQTQGRRQEQQDTVSVSTLVVEGKPIMYMGIFDGHSGFTAAKFAASYLHLVLADLLKTTTDVEAALIQTFERVHSSIREYGVGDGTTAVVSVVIDQTLFVANAGDCRTLLVTNADSRDEGVRSFIQASRDHKPYADDERARIVEAGGFVSENKRANGVLALSRALGDTEFEPVISHVPEITKFELNDDTSYALIMSCDGIYDVMSNEAAFRHALASECPMGGASQLTDAAYNLGSTDNLSTIVLRIDSKANSILQTSLIPSPKKAPKTRGRKVLRENNTLKARKSKSAGSEINADSNTVSRGRGFSMGCALTAGQGSFGLSDMLSPKKKKKNALSRSGSEYSSSLLEAGRINRVSRSHDDGDTVDEAESIGSASTSIKMRRRSIYK